MTTWKKARKRPVVVEFREVEPNSFIEYCSYEKNRFENYLLRGFLREKVFLPLSREETTSFEELKENSIQFRKKYLKKHMR